MNPWSLVILGIGVMLIIIGVQGSYGKVVSALTGRPYTGGTTSQGSGKKINGHTFYQQQGPIESM